MKFLKSILIFTAMYVAQITHAQNVITSSNAVTTPFQSLQELQALAEQHIRTIATSKVGNLHVKAEPLDPRLHLANCINKPEMFLPSGANLSSRTTVGARCNDSNAQWTLYIGVNIETETPVLILNRAVTRDAQLNGLDVIVDTRRVPGLSSTYLTNVEQLKGYSARRDLAAGMLLTPSMLQPTVLIHRGQQVTLQANASGISVMADAIALSDGTANSRIRVRNINTAKEVEGVVDSATVVRVDL